MAIAAGIASTAIAFAAPAHADPDAPTPVGPEIDISRSDGPFGESWTFGNQDFSVGDAGEFEGSVRVTDLLGATDYLIDADDPTGDVTGQYNDFSIGDVSEIYSSLGGTPEAAFDTPLGDFTVPTDVVEALGPSFFEPFGLADGPIPAAADLPSLIDPSVFLP